MKDTPIAGIKFFVKESKIEAGSPDTGTKFIGQVTLTAHFNLSDLWTDIINRLNGLEMHRGGDLQSELIEILQGRVALLEREVEDKGIEDRERAQRAEQAASFSSAAAVRANQHVELLKAQLDMKARELADVQRSNLAWSQWFEAHKHVCSSQPY